MRLHLLAVGARQPSWIREGVETFVRRMPRECALKLVEIPSAQRGKSTAGEGAVRKEGERILKAVPDGALVVAPGRGGKTLVYAPALGRTRAMAPELRRCCPADCADPTGCRPNV